MATIKAEKQAATIRIKTLHKILASSSSKGATQFQAKEVRVLNRKLNEIILTPETEITVTEIVTKMSEILKAFAVESDKAPRSELSLVKALAAHEVYEKCKNKIQNLFETDASPIRLKEPKPEQKTIPALLKAMSIIQALESLKQEKPVQICIDESQETVKVYDQGESKTPIDKNKALAELAKLCRHYVAMATTSQESDLSPGQAVSRVVFTTPRVHTGGHIVWQPQYYDLESRRESSQETTL